MTTSLIKYDADNESSSPSSNENELSGENLNDWRRFLHKRVRSYVRRKNSMQPFTIQSVYNFSSGVIKIL